MFQTIVRILINDGALIIEYHVLPKFFLKIPSGYAVIASMLDEIQSYYFENKVNTESTVFLKGVEEYETQQTSPDHVGESTNDLYSNLIRDSCVEEALVDVKYTHGNDTPDAAETMDLRNVQWIINFKSLNNLFSL